VCVAAGANYLTSDRLVFLRGVGRT
jgi:hypothetical protein